jgi:hypothetical protein
LTLIRLVSLHSALALKRMVAIIRRGYFSLETLRRGGSSAKMFYDILLPNRRRTMSEISLLYPQYDEHFVSRSTPHLRAEKYCKTLVVSATMF